MKFTSWIEIQLWVIENRKFPWRLVTKTWVVQLYSIYFHLPKNFLLIWRILWVISSFCLRLFKLAFRNWREKEQLLKINSAVVERVRMTSWTQAYNFLGKCISHILSHHKIIRNLLPKWILKFLMMIRVFEWQGWNEFLTVKRIIIIYLKLPWFFQSKQSKLE